MQYYYELKAGGPYRIKIDTKRWLVQIYGPNEAWGDIWLWQTAALFISNPMAQSKSTTYPEEWVFPTTSCMWNEVSLPMARHHEKLLQDQYGDEFRDVSQTRQHCLMTARGALYPSFLYFMYLVCVIAGAAALPRATLGHFLKKPGEKGNKSKPINHSLWLVLWDLRKLLFVYIISLYAATCWVPRQYEYDFDHFKQTLHTLDSQTESEGGIALSNDAYILADVS